MALHYANDQPAAFENHVRRIAIIGASGHVGGPIVTALLSEGRHRVTALTRADSKSELPPGLDGIKRVDYDDVDAVQTALQGQEVLIITLSVMTPPSTQLKLIDAAVKAGVKYIMPNEWGIDVDNEDLAVESGAGILARAAREYATKAGNGKTHWIALTAGLWYEHSLAIPNAYGFDFASKTATFFGSGDTKVSSTTWRQCGEAVAKLLALKILPDDANDKSLTLSQFEDKAVLISSFSISQRDMFDSILRVTGDKKDEWTITSEACNLRYQRGVAKLNAGEHVAGHVIKLYTRAFFPNGGGDFSDKVINKELSLSQENLDEATRRAIQQAKDGYAYGPK